MEKLVRDRIPEIMKQKSLNPKITIAKPNEIEKLLINKLKEETQEFEETPCKEELADILEVVQALAVHINIDLKELERFRKNKANKRGAFTKGFILHGK